MKWHVALCEPGRDAIAADNLRAVGYIVHRPIVNRKVIYRERGRPHVRLKIVSMFPSYLFVEPGTQGWHRLRNADGIRRSGPLLMSGSDYAVLPAGALEEIRRTEQALMARDAPAPFAVGEKVAMADGPFAGFFATVADVDGDQAVVLLHGILGGDVRTKAPVHQLEGA